MRKPNPNNPRPAEILQFITDYRRLKGFAPSIREMAEHLNTSTSLVDYYLRRLENQGRIRRDPGIARSIVILEGA